MKTMNCNQLGGPADCHEEFQAETFEEIAGLSKNHGREMYEEGDKSHLKAMQKMGEIMQDPEAMEKWMEQRRTEFEALPEDE